jgi:galacturonosyltransferase
MANTLLEAGAMGRPLITSNIYGCKDAVLDGETGYLVNSQDCQDLYAKISDFILLPFEQKRMMGYKSCEYVRSKFDKRTVVTKTINRLKRE